MNRPQIWKVVGVLLLVCGLQFCHQQAASGAEAAAFAAAGWEALAHGASGASGPAGTFTSFDPPGSTPPRPSASTRRARSWDPTLTQITRFTASCEPPRHYHHV